MASQEKEEKIFIFNDRNLAKNKDIFNFLAEQGNTKPQTLLRSIWHHSKNKKKYLFLTTETWQKNKNIF